MMTSRSEYRLLHRQDNADIRLCGIGRKIGLVSEKQYNEVIEKYAEVEREIDRLEHTHVGPTDSLNALLIDRGTAPVTNGVSLADLVRRPQISYLDIARFDTNRPDLSRSIVNEVEINLKYEGYIKRQLKQVSEFSKLENRSIPSDIDYDDVIGLRLEAREKLKKMRPENFGRAGRISGVSPADISVLMIYTESRGGSR
jgi:NAD/FAD-utilizing enzyme apparently involved in cell division